MGIYKIDIFIN